MHCCFSSVEILFNDEVVSCMTNYAYTAEVCRLLGTTMDQRAQVWDELDGSWAPAAKVSNLDDATPLNKSRSKNLAGGWHYFGRLYSDVLMSARQLLPPGVSLGIRLRRAHDSFSLCSPTNDQDFRLQISEASVYIRRIRIRSSLVPRALESSQQHRCITFNRLECRLMGISQDSRVFRWLDCLNNAPLPSRIYIGIVAQASFDGSYQRLCTFFEPANLRSINFKLGGRDILTEPIKLTYALETDNTIKSAESDGRLGYLSLLEVLNGVSDQTAPVRLSYTDYMKGRHLYAVELGKVGQKADIKGALNLELVFNEEMCPFDACVMLFTERTEYAHFS